MLTCIEKTRQPSTQLVGHELTSATGKYSCEEAIIFVWG
jgi:hypothetical protein